MKKIKMDSDKLTGVALFMLGIAQLVLSSKKEKHNREVMKTEIVSEVIEEINKQ